MGIKNALRRTRPRLLIATATDIMNRMKPGDVNSLVDTIRELNYPPLIVVSILLLPLPVLPWSIYLNGVEFLDGHDEIKLCVHLAITVLFLGFIIGIKKKDDETKKMERAKRRVQAMLLNRRKPWASYQAIREELDVKYKEAFLKKVVKQYPAIFHETTVQSSRGNRPGLALDKEQTEHADD